VPRFEPFRGLRYDAEAIDVGAVIAPPYDVIDEEQRARLAERIDINAVRVELPVDEDGVDRYQVAARLLAEWQEERVLVLDDEPAFYAYRMGYRDDRGGLRQTSGIIGALTLGTGDVLPHEHTTPKAKSDRLDLLRAARTNLSPIWALSTTPGLSGLAEVPGPPVARATDDDGVHHRLWKVDSPGIVAAISEAVAARPLVIADGHHRYETATTYAGERRAVDGPGPWDAVMAYVVELTDDQLSVQAIHRLIAGLPAGFDVLEALAEAFEPFEAGDAGPDLLARMVDAGALALVTRTGTWLLRPRAGTAAEGHDLDSSRLDAVLRGFPAHELTFQHGADHVRRAVERREADAGVLLRPATVDQIAATATGGGRMPPKTTFFTPKPATGMVFRPLG
jgi:uncharacterized protein (DUF1015 family)